MDSIEKMRKKVNQCGNVDELRAIDNTLLAALKDATESLRREKRKNTTKNVVIVCGFFILMTAIICGTVFGCYTVHKQQTTLIEQQYALNMQYASLMDYVAGAEVTTETESREANAEDGETAIVGENNTVVGGNLNGER